MRLAESVGRAMKRFLIFLLLGPLLGLLVFMLRNAFAGKIVGGFMASFLGCHLGTSSAFRLNRNAAATSALHLQLPQILSFGIVGAIPAAVCSWLAGTTENRGT